MRCRSDSGRSTGANDPLQTVVLDERSPRIVPLSLFHGGRRLVLQVGIEPQNRSTQRVEPVLDLHESMAFGRIEYGFGRRAFFFQYVGDFACRM